MNDDSRSIDEFETGIKLACLEGDDRATTLAADLAIPTVANLSEAELCLYYQPQGLSLYSRSINSSICIDYNNGKAGHRRRFGGGKQQLISKACGLHKRSGLKIIDATAGLGYDAFVLASLGANVTMLERNTILQQLLIDALSRLPDDSIKIILQAGDAKNTSDQSGSNLKKQFAGQAINDSKNHAIDNKLERYHREFLNLHAEIKVFTSSLPIEKQSEIASYGYEDTLGPLPPPMG